MTDKREQTKAGATELSEEDLKEVQGGHNFKVEINGRDGGLGKKAAGPLKGLDGKGNDQ